jgi:hypothetical protein
MMKTAEAKWSCDKIAAGLREHLVGDACIWWRGNDILVGFFFVNYLFSSK